MMNALTEEPIVRRGNSSANFDPAEFAETDASIGATHVPKGRQMRQEHPVPVIPIALPPDELRSGKHRPKANPPARED